MALLAQFDTPARVRDVPAGSPFYAAWSNWISGQIGPVTPGDAGGAFYDPTTTNVNVAAKKSLVWQGFPRDTHLPGNRDNRTAGYIAADGSVTTRAKQDEYFEWRVDKNTAGKITKVTFVTELPEYYTELWNIDPGAVVNIYRSLVSPAVTQADLSTASGAYKPTNDWNTTKGIVHDIMGINNLAAAIGLAKSAVRSPAPYGDNFEASPALHAQTTAVDPRVSLDVHMLVRKGLYVSFADPVGIYIVGWNDSGITKPNGQPAGNYWKIVRGVPGVVMRLEYKVPSGLGFVVGDLRIGGRRIEYGGQLAEQISVSITGMAGTPARG